MRGLASSFKVGRLALVKANADVVDGAAVGQGSTLEGVFADDGRCDIKGASTTMVTKLVRDATQGQA